MCIVFLVVVFIDGLDRGINEARTKGNIIGYKITKNIQITHMMFVDDVLFIRHIPIEVWKAFHQIHTCFIIASGLYMNKGMLISVMKEEGIIK